MRFIDDSCYFYGDKYAAIQRCFQLQENNVSIVRMSSSDSSSGTKDYWMIAVKSLQIISVGDKSYMESGSKYSFHDCELSRLSKPDDPKYHALLVVSIKL